MDDEGDTSRPEAGGDDDGDDEDTTTDENELGDGDEDEEEDNDNDNDNDNNQLEEMEVEEVDDDEETSSETEAVVAVDHDDEEDEEDEDEDDESNHTPKSLATSQTERSEGSSKSPIRIKLKLPTTTRTTANTKPNTKISASGLPSLPISKQRKTKLNSNPQRRSTGLLPTMVNKTKSRMLPMNNNSSSTTTNAAAAVESSSSSPTAIPKKKKKPKPTTTATTTIKPTTPPPPAEQSNASSLGKKPMSSLSATKPKSRIRSLKLPLSKKTDIVDSASDATEEVEDDEEEDDEDEGLSAVATVVSGTSKTTAATATTTLPGAASGASTNHGRRHTGGGAGIGAGGGGRSGQVTRVRIPQLYSPGLLLAPSTNNKQQQQQSQSAMSSSSAQNQTLTSCKEFSTPGHIFDQAMTAAGYTLEAREQRPFRGSSTTRTVGDMFDSNVKLCLHFPPLVPPELWEATVNSRPDSASGKQNNDQQEKNLSNGDKENQMTLPDLLIRGLQRSTKNRKHKRSDSPTSSSSSSRGDVHSGPATTRSNGKRPRPWTYREMLPVPLTIPYPDELLEKEFQYVQLVREREKTIIQKQEQEELNEIKGMSDNNNDDNKPPVIQVPPIPPLPDPPVMTDPEFLEYYDSTKHPLYLPKAHPDHVKHLDKQCFHITQGRYFGLLSNRIADPNFVGANAPGIAGVTAAGGAGLATSTSGTTTTTFMLTSVLYKNNPAAATTTTTATTATLATNDTTSLAEPPQSPISSEAPVVTATVVKAEQDEPSTPVSLAAEVEKTPKKKKDKNTAATKATMTASATTVASPETSPSSTLAAPSPIPKKPKVSKAVAVASTASLNAAATALAAATEGGTGDGGGPLGEANRQLIIKSAVYASRTGKMTKPFVIGSKVYPDVTKAFAAHAGVKPCQRCKNNKQGAYHCRLRRKHFDPDFDGGESVKGIKALFDIPVKQLLASQSNTKQQQQQVQQEEEDHEEEDS